MPAALTADDIRVRWGNRPPTLFIGWFDAAEQTTPTYDPSHTGPCAVCLRALLPDDMRTVNLLPHGGNRSIFYRLHRTCSEALSEGEHKQLDSAVLVASQRLPHRRQMPP